MSFAPEVIADSSGTWAGNALRFATREEADANVRNLMMRWYLVTDTRVVESTDPVNYRWEGDAYNGKLVEVTPRVARTSDGYCFTEQDDGTWTDGDLTFASLDEIIEADPDTTVDGKPVERKP